eukprot:349686-Chlamydomonas_euryale.AAC.6
MRAQEAVGRPDSPALACAVEATVATRAVFAGGQIWAAVEPRRRCDSPGGGRVQEETAGPAAPSHQRHPRRGCRGPPRGPARSRVTSSMPTFNGHAARCHRSHQQQQRQAARRDTATARHARRRSRHALGGDGRRRRQRRRRPRMTGNAGVSQRRPVPAGQQIQVAACAAVSATVRRRPSEAERRCDGGRTGAGFLCLNVNAGHGRLRSRGERYDVATAGTVPQQRRRPTLLEKGASHVCAGLVRAVGRRGRRAGRRSAAKARRGGLGSPTGRFWLFRTRHEGGDVGGTRRGWRALSHFPGLAIETVTPAATRSDSAPLRDHAPAAALCTQITAQGARPSGPRSSPSSPAPCFQPCPGPTTPSADL